MKRFTLYGSPHSLPTYKVALMLRLSGEPFSFRYVSFQKGMHKTSEFLALSRWGQVPVLVDSERIYAQSAAIVEHLAETLRSVPGAPIRQHARLFGNGCTGASMRCFHQSLTVMPFSLVERKLLPIAVEPMIADYYRRRAEAALSVLDSHLANRELSLCC